MILFSGILTGLLLSAPIGPANILCIQRTITAGRLSAFIVGLGAAIGDLIYVILSLCGLIALSDLSGTVTDILRYVGGGILVFMGLFGLWRARTSKTMLNISESYKRSKRRDYIKDFMTSFIMTTTNPLTPVGVLTAVTAMGLGGGVFAEEKILSACIFGLAIFLGSISWWVFLSFLGEYCIAKLSDAFLNIMNIYASLLLFFIGIYIIIFDTNYVVL